LKNIQAKSKRAGKRAQGSAPRKRGAKKAIEKLRKSEVELLRDMFEFDFWSVEELAVRFEISTARVKSIVTYKQDG
jgi:hypothetical protein